MNVESSSVTIVLADDHPLFRKGVQQALSRIKEIKVLAEANNGLELCALVEQFHPHVVITDISMPLMCGIEATKRLKKRYPQLGIVVLSMHDDLPIIRETLTAGANAFLLKTAEMPEVLMAIRAAKAGQLYVSEHVSKSKGHIFQNAIHTCTFTKRESEVIQLLFEELTSDEIGDKLYVSKRTIEEHRKNILKKIGAKNIVGLIKYVIQKKLVKIS